MSELLEEISTEEAVQQSSLAFSEYKNLTPMKRFAFLEEIVACLEAKKDLIIQTAMRESKLPEGRLNGEFGRTTGQIRLFQNLIKEDGWKNEVIELADPTRTPVPKPDTRKSMVPLGPVVVFGASNFPLAFSTIGGDSISALAAGCTVLYKANPAHLETSRLVNECIQEAIRNVGLSPFVFQHFDASGYEEGQQLVLHSLVKAVAFTGSFHGGKAIYDLAQSRKEPIPVFAEMGSLNPVCFFESSLSTKATELAKTFAGSFTLGCGQFCTKPGLMIGVDSQSWKVFVDQLIQEAGNAGGQAMLTSAIQANFTKGLDSLTPLEVKGTIEKGLVKPSVKCVSAKAFMSNCKLQEEYFGPFTLVVTCADIAEMHALIQSLEGQLTGTIVSETNDDDAKSTMMLLTEKVGRIIFNAAPTGVEVNHSMVHGGPFPATTDARFTSVGSDAIYRFVRPVCFQGIPQEWLPESLQTTSYKNIHRK